MASQSMRERFDWIYEMVSDRVSAAIDDHNGELIRQVKAIEAALFPKWEKEARKLYGIPKEATAKEQNWMQSGIFHIRFVIQDGTLPTAEWLYSAYVSMPRKGVEFDQIKDLNGRMLQRTDFPLATWSRQLLLGDNDKMMADMQAMIERYIAGRTRKK